jgi:hypothetical protein
VVKGNFMSGSFQLVYEGYATNSISYDASADVINDALEAIDVIGYVHVEEGDVDREGGRKYFVTFQSLPGDVAMLEIDDMMLEGDGASGIVLESIKGSEALGTSMSVSFDVPYGCSTSQVTSGICGSPIDAVYIDVDTTSSFSSIDQTITYMPSYSIQKVRTGSPSLTVKSDLISSTASGFFSLIYEDESTPILSSVASTYDVKQALESISSIDAVVVSRDWSYEQLEGCYLDINENDLYATFSDSSSSDCYAQVYLGDRIRLDDVWYTIYALSSTKIWLGLPDDYTIRSSYNNTDITDLPLYIWSAGYEWSITFVSPSNPSSLLQSPAHGLTPYDAIVEIRPEDCDKCIYIDDLTVWTDYYFRG